MKARPKNKVKETAIRGVRRCAAVSGCVFARTARRADSKVTLLSRRSRVFTKRIGGAAMWIQSVEPCRTNMALVKAAKVMVIENIATHTPLLTLLEAADKGRGGLIGGYTAADMVPFAKC